MCVRPLIARAAIPIVERKSKKKGETQLGEGTRRKIRRESKKKESGKDRARGWRRWNGRRDRAMIKI